MAINGAMKRRRRRKRQADKYAGEWEELEVSENGIIVLNGITDLALAGKFFLSRHIHSWIQHGL